MRLLSKYPDLRVLQLIGNAVPSEEASRRNNDLYYVEDAQLLEWLELYEIQQDQQSPVTRTAGS